MQRWMIFSLLLLLLGSSLAGEPDGKALTLTAGVEPHPGLDAIYARFTRAYLELDLEAMGDLYTENALYLSPNQPMDRGRETIRQGFSGMFDRAREQGTTLHISFEILARRATDTLAYDVGIYRLLRRRGDEPVRQSAGKFVVVAEPDQTGTWRFQVDGYSALAPPN